MLASSPGRFSPIKLNGGGRGKKRPGIYRIASIYRGGGGGGGIFVDDRIIASS